VVIKAVLSVGPGCREPFLRQMAALVRASLGEPGCLGFACYHAIEPPDEFLVLGEWRDRTALDLHERSAHVAAFKAATAGLVAWRQPTRVYDVAAVGGLAP